MESPSAPLSQARQRHWVMCSCDVSTYSVGLLHESGEFAKVFLDFHPRLSVNPSFNLPGKYYVYCIKDVCVYFIGLESKLLV